MDLSCAFPPGPDVVDHVRLAEELGYRRPALFLLLDGKRDKLERIIMDRIYPRGNHFVADAPPGEA